MYVHIYFAIYTNDSLYYCSFNLFKSGQAPQDSDSGISTDGKIHFYSELSLYLIYSFFFHTL